MGFSTVVLLTPRDECWVGTRLCYSQIQTNSKVEREGCLLRTAKLVLRDKAFVQLCVCVCVCVCKMYSLFLKAYISSDLSSEIFVALAVLNKIQKQFTPIRNVTHLLTV